MRALGKGAIKRPKEDEAFFSQVHVKKKDLSFNFWKIFAYNHIKILPQHVTYQLFVIEYIAPWWLDFACFCRFVVMQIDYDVIEL